MSRPPLRALSCTVLLALAAGAAAGDPQLPAGFEVVPVAGQFDVPVDLAFAPDGTLFIVQKPGVVRVLRANGTLQSAPFINLVDEVNNNGDRGLVALALHPGWVPDGGDASWVYLAYTVSPVPGQDWGFDQDDRYSFSRLARWKAKAAAGSITAQSGTRQVLLGRQLPDGSVPDGIASLHISHSNGTLLFGEDGSLLFSAGDGAHWDVLDTGGFDDAGFDDFTHPVTGLRGPIPAVQDSGALRAQDLRSLAGKVLRLDPQTGLGLPDNPFFDGDPASHASRVWALGLRSNWRMALVPGTGADGHGAGDHDPHPGTLVVGDVGQARWEELDACRGGENFGWPCREGPDAYPPFPDWPGSFPGAPTCATAPGTPAEAAVAWHHFNPALLAGTVPHVQVDGLPGPGFKGRAVIVGQVVGAAFPPPWSGRLFVSDYTDRWLKAVALDAQGVPVEVRDFASGLGAIVDMAVHPQTGELWWCLVDQGRIERLRFAGNFSPLAQATADPASGPAPLAVQFDGSGSLDPEGQPLAYAWDFGDGSPVSPAVAPLHVYQAAGSYQALLTVTDDVGQQASAALQVVAGGVPFTVVLDAPRQGDTYLPPAVLELRAHVEPDVPVSWSWTVDLHHDTHVHPASFASDAPQAALAIGGDAHEEGLVFHRVRVTATHASGTSASADAWVFDQRDVHDVTGEAQPAAKVQALQPPFPLGAGHKDLETLRDGVRPPVGSSDPLSQWDSAHGGEQGGDDWLGLFLAGEPPAEQRFVALEFQEGLHAPDGGWFETLAVEVRHDGDWEPVTGLRLTPGYPFELAGQPGFDRQPFQTWSLRFDPAHGDAIRLRGAPGGSGGFVSCAELRARVIRPASPSAWVDLAGGGTPVARVLELDPPGPLGQGSRDIETIRNGTRPPPGSASLLAQYDTFHFGEQGQEDWIGYTFPLPQVVARVVFQEGLHFPDGGAFADTPAVQAQLSAGGPWTTLPLLGVAPAYGGLDGEAYETYTFDFAPVLAHGVRLHGVPAGARRFVSVAELQVQGPPPAGAGEASSYCVGLGGVHTLGLQSPWPPGPGLPLALVARGGAPATPGLLLMALQQADVPFAGGALLVQPAGMALFAFAWDAQGRLALAAELPPDPALEGLALHLQVAALGQPPPWPIRLGNGVSLELGGG